MTLQESIDQIHRRLKRAEAAHEATGKALASLHDALASALSEHADSLGVSGETVATARAPKEKPQ